MMPRPMAAMVVGSGTAPACRWTASSAIASRLGLPTCVQRIHISDPASQFRPVMVEIGLAWLMGRLPSMGPAPELLTELKSSGLNEVQLPEPRLVALVL